MEGTAGTCSLATLAVRPPTPPHNAMDTVLNTSDNTLYLTHLSQRMLDTPDESPTSSVDYFSKSSSERLPKRVDFLSDNSNLLTRASKSIIALGRDVRALPRSKDCKPSKSILKPYKENLLSDPMSEPLEQTPRSFSRMLEDIVCELTSSSRSSRLDAYQTLNGCLKAYEDVPDPETMVDKLPLLVDFIRRDLTTESAEKGILDTQLTTQVLKLLTILLWTPKLAEMLTDDFCVFVLNQSITVIGDHSSSKTLVNHYMHLIATQKFRHKIITNDRANRLLSVLGEITSYVKGNGVVGQRLMIYRTLLTQANGLMTGRVNDWIDHLFSGMLSNIKEVRSRALAFGFDASTTLGTVSKVSHAVLDIFDRESPEGKKFSDVLISRLEDMLALKEESVHVPQIWSVTVLFLRSHRSQIERWEYMRVWIVILQKCFNSSDNNVKFQAHQAWNRLIFAINPTVSTSSSMVKMLRQPVVAQLERRPTDKHTRQAKQIALASYCTLLYYALRPGSSHDSLDRFWDEYVAPLLPKMDSNFACQVLTSILGNTHQHVWTEHRVKEASPIKPEELPRVDPQWVRQRFGKILKVLEPFLQSNDWGPCHDDEPWLLQAWRAFTRALGDAGSKEVKVSMATMAAIAYMMNSMKRTLEPDNLGYIGHRSKQSTAVQRFSTLVNIAVENLGTIPFADKRVVQTSGRSFEIAETPSSRAVRVEGYLASPILHLINMLLLSGDENDEFFEKTTMGFIQIALRSATSRHTKVKVLYDIAHLTTLEEPTVSKVRSTLWQLISDVFITYGITSRSDDGSANSAQQSGHDFRYMLKVVELEAQNTAEMTLAWAAAFGYINAQLQQECGTGASTLIITEPFADFLYQKLAVCCTKDTIQRATVLISNTLWPESRKDLDRGHKALWGPSSIPPKSHLFNPFDKLYTLVDRLLLVTYEDFESYASDDILDLLQSVDSFIRACPTTFSTVLVKRIQVGLARWTEDAKGRMNGPDQKSQALYSTVVQIWNVTTQLIGDIPKFDTSLLSLIDVIFSAGLSSRHRSILNRSIELWNSTFGFSADLRYPPSILPIVQRLRLVTEIQLPGLCVDESENSQKRRFSDDPYMATIDKKHVDLTPFHFIHTPKEIEQNSEVGNEQNRGSSAEVQIRSTASHRDCTWVHPRSLHSYTDPTSTPPPRRQHYRLTPKAQLRHDNSQIHFAAIESSPSCCEAMESQFLTTRQKEVKARQYQEAAAIFPDFLSSPVSKCHDIKTGSSKLNLSSGSVVSDRPPMDEMVSPMLPPANELSNAFLCSSPTPSSSAKRSSRHAYEEDPPPSSPRDHKAFVNVEKRTKLTSSTSQVLLDRMEEMLTEYNADSQPKARETSGSPVMVEHQLDDRALGGSGVYRNRPEEEFGKLEDVHMINGSLPSHFDRRLAAPFDTNVRNTNHVEPSRSDPAEEVRNILPTIPSTEVDFTTDVPPSSIDQTTDMTGSEHHDIPIFPDDEVSAQIANDMEKALSQAAESSKASPPSDMGEQRVSKKRKRLSSSLEPIVKKTTQPKSGDGIQVVIEKQVHCSEDEDMLDCIVVDCPAVAANTHSPQGTNATNPRLEGNLQSVSKNTKSKRQGRPRKPALDAVSDDESEYSCCSSKSRSASILPRAAQLNVATTKSHPVDTLAKSDNEQQDEQSAAASILTKLKLVLEEAKEAVLQRTEEREITSLWFDLGQELQNAGRRSEA